MNQKGISSLLLLIMVVIGVFIIWETNQFVDHYNEQAKNQGQSQNEQNQQPVCLTGEADDCNDSNDVFLLPETE